MSSNMQLTVLTHNLYYNRATKTIGALLTRRDPAVVCFQEIATDRETFEMIEKYGYKLADYSSSWIKKGRVLGVATFYNPKIVSFASSTSLNIPHSFYEFLRLFFNRKYGRRTVLKTRFLLKNTNKKVNIYNLHLHPFATNRLRDLQIKNAFDGLQLNKKEVNIIAGDFNYPYGRRKFEELIKTYKLQEATNRIFYTLESYVFKFFAVRMKVDYVLYQNIKHQKTNKIRGSYSDHFPVLATFSL